MAECSLTPLEKKIVENAERWVACAYRGSGMYDREERPTRDAAREAAAALREERPVMIYAVYRGSSALVETV